MTAATNMPRNAGRQVCRQRISVGSGPRRSRIATSGGFQSRPRRPRPGRRPPRPPRRPPAARPGRRARRPSTGAPQGRPATRRPDRPARSRLPVRGGPSPCPPASARSRAARRPGHRAPSRCRSAHRPSRASLVSPRRTPASPTSTEARQHRRTAHANGLRRGPPPQVGLGRGLEVMRQPAGHGPRAGRRERDGEDAGPDDLGPRRQRIDRDSRQPEREGEGHGHDRPEDAAGQDPHHQSEDVAAPAVWSPRPCDGARERTRVMSRTDPRRSGRRIGPPAVRIGRRSAAGSRGDPGCVPVSAVASTGVHRPATDDPAALGDHELVDEVDDRTDVVGRDPDDVADRRPGSPRPAARRPRDGR